MLSLLTMALLILGTEADQTTAGVACIVAVCLMSAQFTATSDCRSKKNIKDLPLWIGFYQSPKTSFLQMETTTR